MKKLQAVLLCALVLAVLAAADLGYNFFASLVPEINDGISVRGVLAPLLFSDHLLGDFWSRERFLNAFVAAAYALGNSADRKIFGAAVQIKILIHICGRNRLFGLDDDI